MIAVGKGSVISEVFADTVTFPLCRSSLTQGRVDGTGGRGSFAGLSESLEHILFQIRNRHNMIIREFEDMHTLPGRIDDTSEFTHDTEPLWLGETDLVVESVWIPVATILSERFPGMFSVGIANIFARCYQAIHNFLENMSLIAGPEYANSIKRRLRSNSSIHDFDSKWRISVYLQLRVHEISARVDRVCETSRSMGPTHSSLIITSISAPPTPLHANAHMNVGENSSAHANMNANVISMTAEDLDDINSQLHISDSFETSLLKAFAREAAIALHSRILLRPLGPKLFSFALCVFARLDVHLSSILGLSSTTSVVPALADTSTDASATPNKRASQVALPSPSSSAALAIHTNLHSIDDLIAICCDLNALVNWLTTTFQRYCISALARGDASPEEVVQTCINIQSNKVDNLRLNVWKKVCTMLSNVCRLILSIYTY